MQDENFQKQNNLLAIPFDKGVGICVMKSEDYQSKLGDILKLPQFEKLPKGRKNARNPAILEEERIIKALDDMVEGGKINDSLYAKLKPKGSQPARLYGLAKVHKNTVPTRPVLSMPGSAYYAIGNQVGEWLSEVPECQINTSNKQIVDTIKNIKLDSNRELVSFDVVSLYTNVPVTEAINRCADLLYNGNQAAPPVDKETFVELAKLASCDVIMSTHDGFYKQTDGLAMGSPPAPYLANGWLSQYDENIKGDAELYARYMDDVIRDIESQTRDTKFSEINKLHKCLQFTMEREQNGKLPVLDLTLINDAGVLSSSWYSKPSDTGLVMNYHALAPRRYKKSVVSGFVYRIHRCCSNWKLFHESLKKAKAILERNQYPPTFYEPIIKEALTKILIAKTTTPQNSTAEGNEQPESISKHMIFIQYRGKCTEDYARALHRLKAPCTMVMTLRKLKTVLPSLKPPVDKKIRSCIVYKFNCPRCGACYVGATTRHICIRLGEHMKPSAAARKHFKACNANRITTEDVEVLASSSRKGEYLWTLEALYIRELRPAINTKDEWKRKELTIKI